MRYSLNLINSYREKYLRDYPTKTDYPEEVSLIQIVKTERGLGSDLEAMDLIADLYKIPSYSSGSAEPFPADLSESGVRFLATFGIKNNLEKIKSLGVVSDDNFIYFPRDRENPERDFSKVSLRLDSDNRLLWVNEERQGAYMSLYDPLSAFDLSFDDIGTLENRVFVLVSDEMTLLSIIDSGELPEEAFPVVLPRFIDSGATLSSGYSDFVSRLENNISQAKKEFSGKIDTYKKELRAEKDEQKKKDLAEMISNMEEIGEISPASSYYVVIHSPEDPKDKYRRELKKKLDDIGIKYLSSYFFGNFREYQRDPETFSERVKITFSADYGFSNMFSLYGQELKKRAGRPLTPEEYENRFSSLSVLNDYEINSNKTNDNPIKTHFPSLDKLFGGELNSGLLTLSAGTSTGKTTLLVQIADQISINEGRDILYFNLEQDSTQLIAKSLSRLSFFEAEKLINGRSSFPQAIEYNKLFSPYQYAKMTENEKEARGRAIQNYRKYGDHIFFFAPETGLDYHDRPGYSAQDIGARVEEYIRLHDNRKPVVMIDYLQILSPIDDRMTDKQAIDSNIRELKAIISKYGIVVFLISSMNRASQGTGGNLDSGNGSSLIEYSSDYLFTLYFSSEDKLKKELIDTDNTDKTKGQKQKDNVEDEKAQPISRLSIKINKNRTGSTGVKADFLFYKQYQTFTESDWATNQSYYYKMYLGR